MASYNRGFNNISVELLEATQGIAHKAMEFNEWGSEDYNLPSLNEDEFTDKLIHGKTFPKYVFERCTVAFEVKGISRICLAQLTRDNAIFCSESHGLRPLSMNFNIPTNIFDDESIMDKLMKAQDLLEQAYIEACEKEMPYPETRYLGLHAQTINCNVSFTVMNFRRSCFSRTNNSFCDELNLVYRKMYRALRDWIENYTGGNNRVIWDWLINDKSCIDDGYYSRTAVYNGDFNPAWHDEPVAQPAHNDWNKSGWKKEIMELAVTNPELFTPKELGIISNYKKHDLTTYDETEPRVAKNAIKTMPYYKEKR